jgi:chemotaxis protein CheD
MREIIDVNTGEVFVGNGTLTLRSLAIGSCIVITAYDPKTKNAGMAHIMLAGSAPERTSEKNKYAINAIECMLGQMLEAGSCLNDMEVFLVGAGNVLRKEDDTICQNNITSVNEIMEQKKITVKDSVLGGYLRKSVFIDSQTGEVTYTQGDSPVKLLWKPSK